jgi:LPS-assembly protein
MRSATVHIFVLVLVAAVLTGTPRYARSEVFQKKIPVTVTADTLDYDRTNDRYIAIGHVVVEQEGMRLEAEKVVLDNKTGEAVAEGNVFLQDKGDIMHAEKMLVNINTRSGVISNGDIFIMKDNLHVKGNVIKRLSDTVFYVEKGTITTCDEEEWFLKADVLNIDMERYATGRRLSFNVAGMPVLYTPYFLFPVRRQTGFLLPQDVGYSSRDGVFTNNTFFWAISDYKDMTIYSDYRTRTGHGTAVEYRYMNSQESMGQAYYKFFDQYHTGESRWNFQFQHQEEFAEDLSGRVDINLVSDEHYFYDLDKKLENRSKPYIDSNAFYVERWDTASLYLMGQYSIDLTQTNEKTVQKLPELRYTIYDETLAGPLHLNFEGAAANFTRQEEDGARRVDFNPRLIAAFGSSGLSITPKAGVRATFYDRSATSVEPTERRFFYAGTDVNARVSRVYGIDGEAGIGKVRHSLEPTISYSYVPHVDQGNIPHFDSVDFVPEQNLVSIALINRVTAHYKETKDTPNYTTFDVMVFRLSRSYDFTLAREEGGAAHPGSETLGELYLRTPKMFSLSATGSYNSYDSVVTSHSESAGFSGDVVSLNLTHSFTRGGAKYLISGGGLALRKWNLHAQVSRDIQNKKTMQEEYLLHYVSQCWGLSLTYTALPGEHRYTAMVDLKGLGSRGLE